VAYKNGSRNVSEMIFRYLYYGPLGLTPCSLVGGHHLLEYTVSLLLRTTLYGVITQEASIKIFSAMKTLNRIHHT
jgi:hypothetical protein